MRPTVCVETIEIDDKLIDVIKVCNSLNTPFYLKVIICKEQHH